MEVVLLPIPCATPDFFSRALPIYQVSFYTNITPVWDSQFVSCTTVFRTLPSLISTVNPVESHNVLMSKGLAGFANASTTINQNLVGNRSLPIR